MHFVLQTGSYLGVPLWFPVLSLSLSAIYRPQRKLLQNYLRLYLWGRKFNSRAWSIWSVISQADCAVIHQDPKFISLKTQFWGTELSKQILYYFCSFDWEAIFEFWPPSFRTCLYDLLYAWPWARNSTSCASISSYSSDNMGSKSKAYSIRYLVSTGSILSITCFKSAEEFRQALAWNMEHSIN